MPTSFWMSVFHFTGNNENCCIPALWINRDGKFTIVSSVNDNGHYRKNIPFELGKTYQVTIKQVKDGSKYWYEIIINGDSKLKVENKNPLTFSTVKLYGSDPWHDSFSSDFGSFCNVEINRERGKFCNSKYIVMNSLKIKLSIKILTTLAQKGLKMEIC